MIKKESILKGSILTAFFNFLGKILSFFSIYIITREFGANNKTDIFYLLFSFSMLLIAVFSTLQSSVFLPLFLKIKTLHDEKKAWVFSNSFFTYSFLIGIFITLIFLFFPLPILSLISKFDKITILQSKNIVFFFAPVIFLFNATEHLRTIINTQFQFSLPAFMVFINNLIVVLFLEFFADRIGPVSMSLSLFASYIFQFIWLLIYISRKVTGFGLSFKIVAEYKEFFKIGYPLIIAQILGSVSAYFFDYTATSFSGGTLTAISYAQRFYNFPIEMVVLPIVSVLTPFFSVQYAKKKETELLYQYITYNNLLWFAIIPITFILIIFSRPIIEILLQRGFFTSDYITITSNSLKIFAISLFGVSLTAINSKILWSIQKTLVPSILSSISCIINILMVYYLSRYIGYTGIPWSRTISTIFLGALPALIFSIIYIKGFKVKALLIPFVYISLLSSIAAFVSFYIYKYVINYAIANFNNLLSSILTLFFSFVIFAIVYLFLAMLLKIKEFETIRTLVKNKIPDR